MDTHEESSHLKDLRISKQCALTGVITWRKKQNPLLLGIIIMEILTHHDPLINKALFIGGGGIGEYPSIPMKLYTYVTLWSS